MSSTLIAQIVDVRALDADRGTRGRLTVNVPIDWIAEGAEIEIIMPRYVPCDRCGGDGCDRCTKGALFLTEGTIRMRLPTNACSPEGPIAIRFSHPTPDIDQIILRVQPATATSSCVRKIDPTTRSDSTRTHVIR